MREARRASVWNARTPERHPDMVVHAESEQDMVRAVELAAEEGSRIGVRSGGHSWAGNHVRDGGMLLDVSRLDRVEIDREAGTARVGPGCRGDDLLAAPAAALLNNRVVRRPALPAGLPALLQGIAPRSTRTSPPCCRSSIVTSPDRHLSYDPPP